MITDRTLNRLTWLAALISGVLLACLFDPITWSGLVWVAVVPLIWAVWFTKRGERSWWKYAIAIFGRGYLAGLAYFSISLSWLSEVVAPEAGWIMNVVPTGAISLYLAFYPAIWAVLVALLANPLQSKLTRGKAKAEETNLQRKIRERMTADEKPRKGGRFAWGAAFRSMRCATVAACAWVVLEWLRGYLLTGFGWNSLGSTFHNNLYLAQAADLVGEVGLSFAPVFMSVVLADTARRLFAETRAGKFRAHPDFAVGVALIAAMFFYGAGRLEQLESLEMAHVRVLGVQQNYPIDMVGAGLGINDIYDGYFNSTRGALEEIAAEQEAAIRSGEEVEWWAPDWIVFPESALVYPVARDHLKQFSEPKQWNFSYYKQEIKPLEDILGPFIWMTGTNERILSESLDESLADYNSLWIVDEEFKNSRTWGKKHLVPFGEYIPLQEELPFLEELFKQATGGNPFGGSFSRGEQTEAIPVQVGDTSVGVIGAICFEDTVPRVLRPYVKPDEAQVIVNVTNDGWFKESAAAYQHFATARFRAIEFRRPLLRVANNGITAAIGIDGSLRSRNFPNEGERWIMDPEQGPFVTDTLRATLEVPKNGPMSLYALLGDWFVGLCAAGLVALGLVGKFKP